MDFSLSEEQQAIGDLSRQILADQVTPERLKEVESSSELIDRRAWSELAKANLAFAESDLARGQELLRNKTITEQTFEQRTHKRLLDILDPTAKTVDELKKLNLPAGVDITIKI